MQWIVVLGYRIRAVIGNETGVSLRVSFCMPNAVGSTCDHLILGYHRDTAHSDEKLCEFHMTAKGQPMEQGRPPRRRTQQRVRSRTQIGRRARGGIAKPPRVPPVKPDQMTFSRL
jgi:hypothetical protein